MSLDTSNRSSSVVSNSASMRLMLARMRLFRLLASLSTAGLLSVCRDDVGGSRSVGLVGKGSLPMLFG